MPLTMPVMLILRTCSPMTRSLFPCSSIMKSYNMYIRFLGRETIKTKYGKFRAIKFKPLLLKGTIFEGGENMTAMGNG